MKLLRTNFRMKKWYPCFANFSGMTDNREGFLFDWGTRCWFRDQGRGGWRGWRGMEEVAAAAEVERSL